MPRVRQAIQQQQQPQAAHLERARRTRPVTLVPRVRQGLQDAPVHADTHELDPWREAAKARARHPARGSDARVRALLPPRRLVSLLVLTAASVLQGRPSRAGRRATGRSVRSAAASTPPPPTCASICSMCTRRPTATSGSPASTAASAARPSTTSSTTSCKRTASANDRTLRDGATPSASSRPRLRRRRCPRPRPRLRPRSVPGGDLALTACGTRCRNRDSCIYSTGVNTCRRYMCQRNYVNDDVKEETAYCIYKT